MDPRSPNRTDTEALAARTAAAVQALRTRAQRMLDERRQRLTELESRITAQFETVSGELTREAEDARTAAASAEFEARQALRNELEQQQALAAAQRAELEKQSQVVEREQGELAAAQAASANERQATLQAQSEQVAELERRLEQERAKWHDERQQLIASRDELSATVEQIRGERAETEHRLSALQESAQAELAAANERHAELAKTWQSEREQLSAQHESLANELQSARDHLAAAQQQESAGDAAFCELRTKFELALEDAQQLRGRVAELEQELAARPEPDDAAGKEVTALRAARDALVEQVAELETRLEEEAGSHAGEDLNDLRCRFEMAVDDVRQLKTEKAKLEEQLAAARRASPAVPETGATDWAAQKRRLLASLEGEQSPTPERKKERANIEDTVRITDEVVAEKDRELESLRQQLEEATGRTNDERILDTDEVIRAERERLAALEMELNEKLRAAELELSVGRAKITRQQGELEQQRLELEALKKSAAAPAENGSGSPATPKRRWLSKLGLGGDDDG